MICICGSTSEFKVVSNGEFYCSVCRKKSAYTEYELQRYFHLFFIPLFPSGKPKYFVKCNSCGAHFAVQKGEMQKYSSYDKNYDLEQDKLASDILSMFPEKNGHKSSEKESGNQIISGSVQEEAFEKTEPTVKEKEIEPEKILQLLSVAKEETIDETALSIETREKIKLISDTLKGTHKFLSDEEWAERAYKIAMSYANRKDFLSAYKNFVKVAALASKDSKLYFEAIACLRVLEVHVSRFRACKDAVKVGKKKQL